MHNLNDTNRLLAKNVNFYNKRKTDPTARTAICIIAKVNESRFTVDVFIPSTASQISNVTIATGLVSESGTGLSILPTVGQKGMLLMSSQHSPVLITTLPNSLPENRNSTLLSGEYKLGSKDSFFKLSKDKSLSSRTLSSASILNNDNESKIVSRKLFKGYGAETEYSFNQEASMGYSKEVLFSTHKVDYFKAKNSIVNEGNINEPLKEEIIQNNIMLLDKLNSLIYKVDEIDNEIELGSIDSIEKLNKLKQDIISTYTFNNYDNTVIIEKGATEDNEAKGSSLTITLKENGVQNSSVSLQKDGTIVMKCKDFIIEREE